MSKFKNFIQRYGLIGYPVEKFKILFKNKIALFDDQINKLIIELKKYFENERKKLKNIKISKKDLIEKEKKEIFNFLDTLYTRSYNILFDILKDCNEKEKKKLIEKHNEITDIIQKLKNDLRNNELEDFYKKHKI